MTSAPNSPSIVAQKGAQLACEAHAVALARTPATIEDELVFTIEEIIARENALPKLISLIYKNFSWELFSQALAQSDLSPDSPIARLIGERGKKEAERLLFMIIELVSSVAYNGIILGEPQSMDEMRAPLLAAVRRLLKEEA